MACATCDEVFPSDILARKEAMWGVAITTEEFAHLMDNDDPLRSFRNKFYIPKMKDLRHVDKSLLASEDEEALYFCGHSLGLQPKSTENYLKKALENWAVLGVESHYIGYLPGIYCDRIPKEPMASLVGAKPDEIAIMNGLTVNLHVLMASFYRPRADRHKILIEDNAFPSDLYAVKSQITFRGYSVEESLLLLKPRKGEYCLREEEIISTIEKEGTSIAMILLPGVQYYTGQVLNMKRITALGHSMGCMVGFDLAHAAGNIKVQLHDWNVDFAAWCTYKYLNSGPGGMASVFIHERHTNPDNKENLPFLRGWWGTDNSVKFLMLDEFYPCSGADMFKLSNSSPYLISMIMASLDIFIEAGFHKILQKQLLLTGYMENLIYRAFPSDHNLPSKVQIITPRNPKERGCQLSLVLSVPLEKVEEELQKRGVVCDVRRPSVIRAAPIPLYTSFLDVYKFVASLKSIIDNLQQQSVKC